MGKAHVEERNGVIFCPQGYGKAYVESHGWEGSRIVWAAGKVGIVKYAWVCVYVSVNVGSERGRR